MTSREDILARVRGAIDHARHTVDIDRGYRTTGAPDDLTQLFVERVADYKADVVRCAPASVEAAIAQAIGDSEVVVPAGFPQQVAGGVEDHHLTHQQLDAIDGVVTTATLGIASTGTIVLDHGPGQGRRALTLVPDLHVCVVRASQVVADVPAAVAALDPARPQTWISGPSATSDIELNRVEGVHGPRRLHVIVVDD